MQEERRSKALTTISNILSAVFSPLLVPTYAYAIALWASYLAIMPENTRFLSCGIIFLITAVVPLGTIIFLIRKGVVTDAAISNKSERAIPYAVTIICYLLAAYYLKRMPSWLYMFFIGAAVAAVIDAAVNTRWKISAHATSMGGVFALLFFIGVNHLATVLILPWISTAALMSGAVGSARVYLGRHTLGQVFAGWFVGLIITYAAMCL